MLHLLASKFSTVFVGTFPSRLSALLKLEMAISSKIVNSQKRASSYKNLTRNLQSLKTTVGKWEGGDRTNY